MELRSMIAMTVPRVFTATVPALQLPRGPFPATLVMFAPVGRFRPSRLPELATSAHLDIIAH
jgi:hypothetical protein